MSSVLSRLLRPSAAVWRQLFRGLVTTLIQISYLYSSSLSTGDDTSPIVRISLSPNM